MPDCTSQTSYDEVIRRFIYGEATAPDNVASEAFLSSLETDILWMALAELS